MVTSVHVFVLTGGNTTNFSVRLVGGNNDAEGRVEVSINGVSGTICDDSWDISDADVVCRMLGFGNAIDAPCCAQFGPGSGAILLDEVSCSGTESSLEYCNFMEYHDCDHYEDASVICDDRGAKLPFSKKKNHIKLHRNLVKSATKKNNLLCIKFQLDFYFTLLPYLPKYN